MHPEIFYHTSIALVKTFLKKILHKNQIPELCNLTNTKVLEKNTTKVLVNLYKKILFSVLNLCHFADCKSRVNVVS